MGELDGGQSRVAARQAWEEGCALEPLPAAGGPAKEEGARHARYGNSVSAPLARHLLRARDLIDRAYAEPLEVAVLARRARVSRSHFNRSFKRTFGETPHRYLLSRRLERAKALLRDSDLSVTDVCLAVGFTSLGSFSTQFRRFVGASPSDYRRRGPQPHLERLPSCYIRMFTRPR
jgi:AraC-like DNA-binding protein